MFFAKRDAFLMATGQREPSEESFPLPNRLFPQKVFPREHKREHCEDGPSAAGLVGGPIAVGDEKWPKA